MAIIGFLSLCRGMRNIFDELIESEKLNYLATYKFSQDHIELVFNMIRSRLGYNNNPSSQQFKAAYKNLLVANEVKCKRTGNCTETGFTKLLSWDIKKFQPIHDPQCFENQRHLDTMESPTVDYVYSPLFFSSCQISEYSENVVVYIAGFVVKQISKKMLCDKCEESLYGDNSGSNLTFLLRKNNGGLVIPSDDIVRVCRLCESTIRLLLKQNNGVPPKGPVSCIVRKEVMKHLNLSNMFLHLHDHALENEFPENHILRIVKLTIDMYIKIRCHHTAKSYNVSLHKKVVRQHLTKSILFMNH